MTDLPKRIPQVYTHEDYRTVIHRTARQNWQRALEISRGANAAGLNVSPRTVVRHMDRFQAWAAGMIGTGTLMKATGVRQNRKERRLDVRFGCRCRLCRKHPW